MAVVYPEYSTHQSLEHTLLCAKFYFFCEYVCTFYRITEILILYNIPTKKPVELFMVRTLA